MRLCIALGLFLCFTAGCFQSSNRPVRYSPPPATETVKEKTSHPAPRLSSKNSSVQNNTAPTAHRSRIAPLKTNKIHLPTHLHAQDLSVMVLVPADNYQVSAPSSPKATPPLQTKTLRAFYIDRTEITVKQYQAFQEEYESTGFTNGLVCPQCPAVGVDWYNAQRYCLWAGKKLPTEAEWEAAARGPTSQPLPWGNKHFPKGANLLGAEDGFDRLAPVGSFPLGASPFAAMDMIGNAWEWVGGPSAEKSKTSGKQFQQVKGGSWRSSREMSVISFRNTVEPTVKNPTFGFRCVKPAALLFQR